MSIKWEPVGFLNRVATKIGIGVPLSTAPRFLGSSLPESAQPIERKRGKRELLFHYFDSTAGPGPSETE